MGRRKVWEDKGKGVDSGRSSARLSGDRRSLILSWEDRFLIVGNHQTFKEGVQYPGGP